MPVEDSDPQRARMLCAAVCRDLFGDLAPALVLLSTSDRQRVQALTAYTRTLFDFALATGMHGERLARINRWEYSLEQSLDDEPSGQPVFVAMASTHADRPWNRDALDAISAAARRCATRADLETSIPALVAALFEAVSGHRPSAELTDAGSRLLALFLDHRQRAANEAATSTAQRRSRPALPQAELALLSKPWRCFLIFLSGAGDELERRQPGDSRTLGLLTRLRLLLRARLSRSGQARRQ
jgi:hypothetical protein